MYVILNLRHFNCVPFLLKIIKQYLFIGVQRTPNTVTLAINQMSLHLFSINFVFLRKCTHMPISALMAIVLRCDEV